MSQLLDLTNVMLISIATILCLILFTLMDIERALKESNKTRMNIYGPVNNKVKPDPRPVPPPPNLTS